MRLIEKVWKGDTPGRRLGRTALYPLEGIYRSVIAVRERLFDGGLLPVTRSPIDVISVGNLTVGGTGKTPVSAWLAARLAAAGRKPAIVLRGYGDDEPIVHSRLNPGVPVVVERDRVKGIARAAAAGANVAVLDDAFQHRAAQRDADVVLVSADDWTGLQHVLPAGPYRQPAAAIKRASLAVITVKAASAAQVAAATEWVGRVAPDVPTAVLRLVHSGLAREAGAERLPIESLSGKRVLALAAVGNPSAFFRQLEAVGAAVVPLTFPDHHAFSSADVARAVRLSRGVDYVVCTLKDAVKLAPLWPATEAPLWYVSLSVEVASGGPAIDEMLRGLPGRGGR